MWMNLVRIYIYIYEGIISLRDKFTYGASVTPATFNFDRGNCCYQSEQSLCQVISRYTCKVFCYLLRLCSVKDRNASLAIVVRDLFASYIINTCIRNIIRQCFNTALLFSIQTETARMENRAHLDKQPVYSGTCLIINIIWFALNVFILSTFYCHIP